MSEMVMQTAGTWAGSGGSLLVQATDRWLLHKKRCQCDSIQGREPGMDLEPSVLVKARLLIFGPLGRIPVVDARLGLSAARSLII